MPIESDFREAWRYRDWVIQSHNRDLPFTEFVRCQIAGDLLQPADPEKIDADALVATGLLAIVDFVPGDVDKERMIADYVNDQIDVVGRAFLGLSLSARDGFGPRTGWLWVGRPPGPNWQSANREILPGHFRL